jgi:hypothetical protein
VGTHHINTVEGIIDRWTAGEAPQVIKDNYARKIREHTKTKPHEIINLWKWRTLYAVTRGIIEFENGNDPYNLRTYKEVFPLLRVRY